MITEKQMTLSEFLQSEFRNATVNEIANTLSIIADWLARQQGMNKADFAMLYEKHWSLHFAFALRCQVDCHFQADKIRACADVQELASSHINNYLSTKNGE